MDKAISMLGLAERAGKLASGSFSCEKAVRDGKAFLVILSGDAKKNTVSSFTNMCAYRGIPMIRLGTTESLGHAIGKGDRSAIAVTDRGFADSIRKAAQRAASCAEQIKDAEGGDDVQNKDQ